MAELLLPETRVELAVDSADLPGILLALAVGSLEDVDTLDDWGTWAQSSGPSESNGLASDGFNGKNLEANGRLGALASLEGGLAGESDAA